MMQTPNKKTDHKRNLHTIPIKKVVLKEHSAEYRSGERVGGYHFVEKNTVLVSFLSAVFFPYILGMLLMLVLFYFYVGVSVTEFFHVYSGLSQFIFWILGMYLIITVIDIWLLAQKIFTKGNKL
jgi:hypothetical protein